MILSKFGPNLAATFAPVSLKLPALASAPLQQSGAVTIDYIYDPLYRLTEANYSNGDYYHYTYDAVGNRLTQQTLIGSVPLTTNYAYDASNRLTSVDSVSYTWDNNGNLLNDGVNSYTYNTANQLTAMSGPFGSSTFAYNGLGDRLTQNGVNYTLDLNSGLTQVLSDGTNTYLYGLGRIAQVNTSTLVTDYFITDALGSVRQLTDAQGAVTLANAYEPYGSLAQFAGGAQTSYGFTGEYTDPSGRVYLRARYYSPAIGRFQTRDTWMGDYNSPLSLNRWNYTSSNPINYSDPSGYCTGYKGIDPFINTAMSFTALYVFDADHWRATGNSWKESWNTCVESFQKASVEYQRGNYWRAYLYANGVSASLHQAAARIEQINRELDTIWCEDASLGERIYAALDVGAWSIGIASFITPFAYEGWLVTKGAISNKYLSGLSVGVPDEFLPPSITGQYRNWDSLTTSSLRFTQSEVSPLFSSRGGDWANLSIEEVMSGLRRGELSFDNELLVFMKTPEMNTWPTRIEVRPDGTIYTGSFARLEDFYFYSINNRGLTAVAWAERNQIPVKWATLDEIRFFSYQYDTANFGNSIWIRWQNLIIPIPK